MRTPFVPVLITLALLTSTMSMALDETAITDLRCEHRVNPLGIDAIPPRLSWRLVTDRRGAAQRAYQILVASRPDLLEENTADRWNSKRRASDQSILVPYEGKPLTSHGQYFWKVRVWDESGKPTAWSETAYWTMGLLHAEDWNARWIGLDEGPTARDLDPASWIWFPEGDATGTMPVGTRYFRFTLDLSHHAPLESVRAVFAADNTLRLMVNGTQVGTCDDYHLAGEFFLGDDLRAGRNVIAVEAANRGDAPNPAGLIGVIYLNYADGATQTAVTNAQWRVSSEQVANWTDIQFDDSRWPQAVELGPFGVQPWGVISTPADRRLSARMLRRTFQLDKPVRNAFVYMSGQGLSELYVNGQRVGDYALSPALSEYDKRVYYVTHDVTELLRPGRNALGVLLGNGRFYAPRGPSFVGMRSYGYPKLLLQLHVTFQDGASMTLGSDAQWKVNVDGPIRANNEYDGEEYDARREIPEWNQPDFDDTSWQPAAIVDSPGGVLAAQMIEPIRIIESVKPQSLASPRSGVFIYDLGQNIVGWCRLRVQGPRGTTLTLRHAEALQSDGNLYVANLRSAKAADVYVLKGEGLEVYEPRFTYHGFRYVELRGFPGTPDLSTLEGRVVHDDVRPTGEFVCSDETINRIYRNAVWGIRGNYRSVPTDCPQRDERQGWLGDRSEESRGEMYLFDLALLYAKWVQDMADAQRENGSVPDVAPSYYPFYTDNVTWPSSSIIIPGVLYEMYGDSRPLELNYPAMRRWIDYMCGFLQNGLIDKDQYGDWCVPPESPELIHSNDPARKTAGPLIASAYFYHDLQLIARYATTLGIPEDAARFRNVAAAMREAFNRKYLNTREGYYDNGTQTSCVLPLAFGIPPARRRGPIFRHLVDKIMVESNGHIGTGLIGCQWLMRVLTDNGRADIGYILATRTDYPSWGYMIENDATTIWELWNGNTADPAMNSHNHVMLLGDLLVWLYAHLAGIQPDVGAPGFKHIIMKPQPIEGLSFVRAGHVSPYGEITSHWRREGDTFDWQLRIPPNTTADVHVPTSGVGEVREGEVVARKATGVRFLRRSGNAAVFRVQAGAYRFQSRLKPTTSDATR